MNLRFNFSLFGKRINTAVRISENKTEWIGGIGNRVYDKKRVCYVPFLDYDGVPLEYILEELDFLIKRFYLSDAYLFKTMNGYHVIFLDKLYLGEVLDILNSSACDKDYRDVPLLYGRKVWVLRQTNKGDSKIEFMGIVSGSEIATNEKSLAHALFLNNRYNIKIKIDGRFDNNENLLTAQYYIRKGGMK